MESLGIEKVPELKEHKYRECQCVLVNGIILVFHELEIEEIAEIGSQRKLCKRLNIIMFEILYKTKHHAVASPPLRKF